MRGSFFVASDRREIEALRVEDGSSVWEGEIDGRHVWAVERFGEVYVEAEGRLHVLDIHNGQRLRAFDLGGRVVEVSEHGWIHTVDEDGHGIAVHHPATGEAVWRATLPDEVEYATSMGQLGDALRLGVVLGDGRLVHLTMPLLGPPLMHETMRPDEGCPESPQQDRDFSPRHQQALVGVYVEIAGLGTSPAVPSETWILLTADPDEEDVLVRGRQIDGPGSMSFTDGQDAFRGEARTYGENLPPLVRVLPGLDGPGCWAYQVDRDQVSDLLVFELSSEDYEKTPPARHENP